MVAGVVAGGVVLYIVVKCGLGSAIVSVCRAMSELMRQL